MNAITNPHSPGKYRVNGLVVNMPEFEKAFFCKAGQPMTKRKPLSHLVTDISLHSMGLFSTTEVLQKF